MLMCVQVTGVHPRGMTCMLDHFGLKLEGRHHSGIDDCRNIARVCACMLAIGWTPVRTHPKPRKRRSKWDRK